MSQYGIRIDRFSAGLDDLTKKEQKDHLAVLRKLATMRRYSIFEATDNPGIAKTMDYIVKAGLIEDTGGEYPWCEFKLTDAALAALKGT